MQSFVIILLIVVIVYQFFIFYKLSKVPSIDITELKKMQRKKNIIIIDVRTKHEYSQKHLKNAINIPLTTLKNKVLQNEFSKDSNIVIVCRSGMRSAKATLLLQKLGYKNVCNLKGGMLKVG